MNWHDVIEVNGQQVKVEPVAGALVALSDGAWYVLRFNWTVADVPPYYVPILPAVPPGLTCWDVLALLANEPVHAEDGEFCIELEAGNIWVNDPDWPQSLEHKTLELDYYCRDHEPEIHDNNADATERDLKKRRALLDWIRINPQEQ